MRDASAYSGAALAIVPRGTANLFARALGVPAGLDAALRVGFGADERLVDLAVCEGGSDGVAFAAMAGIGLDAAVVHSTPRLLKDHLGWVGYAAGALAHLGSRPHDFALSLDGGRPLARRATASWSAMSASCLAVFPSCPARPCRMARWTWASWPPARAGLGGYGSPDPGPRPRRRPPIRAPPGKTVEVTTGTDLPREVDGDTIAHGRSLLVKVLPKALLVRAPLWRGSARPATIGRSAGGRAPEYRPGPRRYLVAG